MSHKTAYARLLWVFLCVFGSLLALNAMGEHQEIEAASLQSNGGDPALEGVTLTVGPGLALSDTLPGAPTDRPVYFNNAQAGVLTLTFEISGTAPLTLTPGAAFGYTPTRRLTSAMGALTWQPVVTYPVPTTATTETGVGYTVLNAGALSTTLWLTYVRDVNPPTVTLTAPAVLTTAHGPDYALTGTAEDPGAGVAYVEVLTESGAVWEPAAGAESWTYAWTLPDADHVVYTPTARATDHVGNQGNFSQTVVVDTVAPMPPPAFDAGAWSPTTTVVFTWTAATDGAGLRRYLVNVTGTLSFTQTAFTSDEVYTLTAAAEGETYYARLQAEDANGNRSPAFGPSSDGITPDLTPPTVTYGTPPILTDDTTWISPTGATVFYTNSMILDKEFRIQGIATDALSGPGSVTATAALATAAPFNGGTWESWHFDYTIDPGMTESGQITVAVRDNVGHPATLVYTYTLDDAGPYTGSVTINHGDSYTNDPQVTLDLYADDAGAGVDQMCIAEASTCSSWENYQTPRNYTLSTAEGLKTVYVWYRDYVGNASGPYTDTITLSTTPPPDPSLTLHDRTTGSPDFTNARVVSATVADDAEATAWLLSETQSTPPTEDNPDWTTTEPITFELTTAGDGEKTVYAWVKDVAGNVNPGPVSATITLDTTPPPAPSLTLHDRTTGSPDFTNARVVSATVADDAEATAWLLSETQTTPPTEDNPDWTTTEPITFELTTAGDGEKTVYAWVKDAAGNVSAGPVSATITLSTTPPPDPSLTLHDRTTGSPDFTNARVVSATVGNDTEATAWLLSETQTTPPTEDNPDWTTTEPITFELTTAGDGEKTVYAWVKDAAGNVSAGPVSATIFVDTRAPTVIVTVPTQAATTPVTVSWEADDPAPSSDNLTYRVHYRQDDADWKTWYESTTLTTADFVSTTLGHTYTFSVTAQDAAGNAGHGQATLRYEKFKVFIPLTSRNWAAWYAEDLNEPNDTRDQSGANILLEPNKIYEAYIWHADDNDYYAYSGQSGNIRIHLDLSAKGLNPDVDYDLYIYDGETGEMVAWSNYTKVPTEEVEFSAEAEKKYYIRVYPFQGYNNDVPYKLTIHDPG